MLRETGFEFAAEVAGILQALGNGKRLAMMQLLRERELSVGRLAELVDLSQSAVSQHLGKLRKMGLVETRRERQTVFYTCSSGSILDLLEAIDRIYAPVPRARSSSQQARDA